MKTIVIASSNPVKAKATLAGFSRMFPAERFSIQEINASLTLPAQPATDEETLACAEKRARNACELAPERDRKSVV